MKNKKKQEYSYAVGQMEQKTGTVLDTDGEPFTGQGEIYTFFNDLESAKAFARSLVRFDHRISCWIEDAQGQQVLSMDRKGEHP